MARLYAGQWVAVAGTREVGYLVREERHFGDPGWYVSLREGWEAWIRVGNLIPWQPDLPAPPPSPPSDG